MENVVNSLRGNVRVEIEGTYPERFMNMCAENAIAFWDLERVSAICIRVTMHIAGYRRMCPLLENVMCTAKTVRKGGVPFFIWRIRKRYVLIAGVFLLLMLVGIMTMFIWDISVEGNETVSTAEILTVLEELGVAPGTLSQNVNSESLRNEVLLKIPDLLWMTVHINGSKATVIVREREKIPEMLDEDTPVTVYAAKSGVIERMVVFAGETLVPVGATVAEGDDIISGVVGSQTTGSRLVAARADIYARTWYELSMQMPLEAYAKRYLEQSDTKTSILFGKNRINLYFDGGIKYASYDKIVKESNLTLPGGVELPIKIATATYTEYEKMTYTVSEDAAKEILTQRLLESLEDMMIENGERLKTDFHVTTEDGVMTVTMNAECLEQIAKTRVLSDQEQEFAQEDTEEGIEENP